MGAGRDGGPEPPRLQDEGALSVMKNCKLCKLSNVCNDLPGVCILIPYLTTAIVVVSVGYLFVTQEILA
jgi:hypothetical protein